VVLPLRPLAVRALVQNWQLAPPLVPITAVALLYALGMRRRARAGWFAAGMFTLVVAVASPVAAYDDQLLWAHMLQHVLLLTVAPPLILLGRPGITTWRALPLSFRRQTARAVAHGRWWAPVRAAVRVLTTPALALGLFVATMAFWHLPALYNATLRYTGIHELEHVLFLGIGMLFWSRLIDSPPLWSRLALPVRALYACLAMVACWILALLLGLGTSAVYSGYAGLASRPGDISALADQHLAAGIMWVPGSIPFVLAMTLFAYRWLDDGAERRRAPIAGAAQ
jgi:putative membrane protein